jgi:hypothetical protein
MTPEQLRSEVEDLLRTMPDVDKLRETDRSAAEWGGRVRAVLAAWDPIRAVAATPLFARFRFAGMAPEYAYADMVALLHEALHSLRLNSSAPTSIAVSANAPFTYFDELRKIIETATTDVLVVDPYLDATFVARYLPSAKAAVSVRLLTQKGVNALVPAVQLFSQEHGLSIAVRSASSKLHDRFIFIDKTTGYQSGASFKDGGTHSPTTLTEMVDVFSAVSSIYEDMWNRGKAEN